MSKTPPEARSVQHQSLREILEFGLKIIELAAAEPTAKLREQVLDSLDHYVNSCGEWLKLNVEGKTAEKINAELNQQAAQLLAQHAEVLTHAQTLLSTASRELREFQRRGKGIMRYADYLPKSISMATKQKG